MNGHQTGGTTVKMTLLAGAALLAALSASAEKLAFLGTTDKNPLEYALNETITFTVTLVDKDNGNAAVTGRNLKWTLSGDDSSLDDSGTATSDTPLVVTTAIPTPGFVRLKVQVQDNGAWLDDKDNVFDGGAGADVMNIQEWPTPSNFAAFWTAATNTLYSTPYVPVCTNFNPAGAASGVSYYLFDIPVAAGELNVTGILAKPVNAAAGSCGIISHTAGYGFGRTELPSSSEVLAGNIVINIARHGENPWHPDDAYYTNDVQKGFAKSFCFRNNDATVQDTDYYKMAMRDLRALQYAKSLPEWNGTKLETQGGSMGGWRAIALAALDCDVTKCTAAIPWSADLAGYSKFGYMKGWRPDWTANLDYIDLKNLATLVKCPVTFTAGLGDYVCPPSGEIQLYRALPEPKKVSFTQNMGHGAVHGPNAPKYVLQAPLPQPDPITLNWIGGNNGLWSVAANWQDSVGLTNAVPRNGDTISLPGCTGTKNDIANFMPYMVKVSSYQEHDPASQPVIFRDGAYGIYNTGYLHFDVPTKLEGTNITIFSSSTYVHRAPLSSWDGNPCGIVKTGSSRAGINGVRCSSPADFAGFKYVTIKEGQWIFGINAGTAKMHLLPPDMTVTFDGANTSLAISQPCVFTNFCLRETAAARNMAHAITCQIDNGTDVKRGKLTIRGTPPDDSTVFTGSFASSVDFRWEPASAAKEFVLSGQTSTTTGDVEVANGTLRLTGGATFSQLGRLTLTGGSNVRFVVDTTPAAAFHAQKLSIASADARLVLSEGVTLTFGAARINGRSIATGTYSGTASAGCTQASWISGPGKVVVEDGTGGDTLEWQGPYNGNWSVAGNWKNNTTGEASAVPMDGDTLVFPNAKVGGQTLKANNDLTNLKPYRLELPSGYTTPQGNALVFTEGSWGISNKGYTYYALDTIVSASTLNLYCSSMVGYNHGIYNPEGNPFRIVKTGAGWLGLRPQSATDRFDGMKYIDIQEGWVVFGCQNSGRTDLFPDGMVVTFTGKNTSLQFSKDFTFADFWIREEAGVVGQPHTIGSMERLNVNPPESYIGSLTITGNPPVDSMPFTGTIVNPVSFCWQPASAAKEFVLKGATSISSTTNRIEVGHGTIRFTEGASFTNLTWLTLSGGAESRLVVDTPPAYGPAAKILTLATGEEKVKLASGVVLAVDSAVVGGIALPAGCYRSNANIGGTPVDWIIGGGYVCVGGATPPSPATGAGVAGAWTANGGADTSIGNAANWGAADNTVLPDLTGGTLDASFGTGSGAALDRVADFHGLSFSPSGAFALTSQDPAFYAALGPGGLTTAGGGRTLALGWPLYLVLDQTWTVPSGDTLNVNSPVVGAGALTIKGGGTVNLNSAAEMGPNVFITNAIVNVNADNAFGSCGDPVRIDLTASKLTLNGVTLGRGFTDIANRTTSTITIAANTDNVIEGDISFPNAPNVNWTFGANSSLRIKGSVKRYATNWCYFKDNGTLYLDGPLMIEGGSAYGMGANKTIYFNAPSNNFGTVWFWVMGHNGRINTTVPYAITKDAVIRANGTVTNNVWDLCGCDQGVKCLGFPNAVFTVTSASPATLHLRGVPYSSYVATETTNRVAFAGAANLSYEGTGYHMYNSESTSTGIVQVTSGTFALGPNGKWPNAAKAVVTGGTLKLENKTVFGKETDMELAAAGATVALNYDGAMLMRNLTIDGELRKPGPYGAPGNANVPAANQLSCFTGTGRIVFLGNNRGTLMFFR